MRDKENLDEEPTEATEEETNEELDIYDEGIGDDDYGIIIGPDGELKSLFMPEGFALDPPESVKQILAMLGIDDINTAWQEGNTLH
jgi:hypothetical protein